MIGGRYLRAEIVRKKGRGLVNDPIYNKGLAFPNSERDRLSIRGLVPPSMYVGVILFLWDAIKCFFFCSLDIDFQQQIIMDEYRQGWAARAELEPEDEIIKSGTVEYRM